MATASKLFKEALQSGQCCNDIAHPGACTVNALLNSYKFFWSNARYFAPVVFLPLVVKIRRLNKELLKSTLKYYIESVLLGTITGWSISVMICVFRHLFNEYKYYSFLFVPSMIGGACLFPAPNTRSAQLFKTSIFQCTIESFIIKRKNAVTRAIADSVILQTAIFMTCSAFILHAARNKMFRGFWLLTATAKATPSLHNEEAPLVQSPTCNHPEKSCGRYVARGVRNYLAIGLTLDAIKMVMSKVPAAKQGLIVRLLAKCKNFKMQSGAFLAYYMAVYRLVHCYLNRRTGADLEWNHAVASFLAGSCYLFYPKITLLTYAVVLSIATYWRTFKAQSHKEDNAFVKRIKQINFTMLLYPISMGYLVHTYGIRRRHVGNLGGVIINGVTNNYALHISEVIERVEKRLDGKL